MEYQDLIKDPLTKETWAQVMCKELGWLAQGWKDAKGTGTIFFMDHDEIKNILKNRTVTYARIVVDYWPQKEDPNRVRITVWGNLINRPYNVFHMYSRYCHNKIVMKQCVINTWGKVYEY
eukprot:6271122-Ditylum_brightwellii.AAC.1